MSEPRSRLRERVPVEPLDGARLDRIEQRVVVAARPLLARPRRSPWTPWLLAGTAALATAAVVLALGVGRREPARTTAPVMVATDAEGTRVDLGDALVDVGPDTRFEVVRAGGGIDLVLARGEVLLDVPPRHGRPPLWVHAGDVGVRVVGTGFRVRRGDTVEVEVTHGAVEVHRGEALAKVATGERWSSLDGAVVAIAALTGARDRTDPSASASATAASVPTSAATSSATTIPAGELALAGSAGGPGLRDRRVAMAPGAPSARAGSATSRPAGATRDRARHDDPSPAANATTPRGVPDLRGEVLAAPLGAAPPVPVGATARTPDDRVAAFSKLAFGDGAAADRAAALWGLAYTQAIVLRDDAAALRSLDLYARRSPAGAEIEPVLWLRLRLLCKRGLDATCRVAGHDYVARFPGTTRGNLAARVTESR